MKPRELLALLGELYQERLAALDRHVATARQIADYDVNNTYQYVIAREETHLAWLADAIRDLGGNDVSAPGSTAPSPALPLESERSLAAADARLVEESLNRWRPRISAISHARHRSMLGILLGEMLEHKRFFEQSAAGRDDLLGRHPADAGQGRVLADRWLE